MTRITPPRGARRTVMLLASGVAGVAAFGVLAAVLSGRPGEAPSASEGTVATFDQALLHVFPELETLLPSEVGGVTLSTISLAAAPGSESSGEGELFADALTAVGRSPTELELAVASPEDASKSLAIVAYRVPNLAGEDLLLLLRPEDVAGPITAKEVAGKQVLELTESEISYAYATEEVVYIVGGSPELIEAALRALP